MRCCVSPVLLLSGCMLSFSLRRFPVVRRFHFDDRKMTWFEAQRTCRLTFSDLVTITDQQTIKELQTIKDLQTITDQTFWIGLFRSPWKWSDGTDLNSSLWENFLKEGEGEVGREGGHEGGREAMDRAGSISGEANSEGGGNLWCVVMDGAGKWISRTCDETNHFICFRKAFQDHILVRKAMTWSAAHTHCRKTYTHLSHIFSLSTNNQLRDLLVESGSVSAWIGLLSPGWMWSDGSDVPYMRWGPGQPSDEPCVMMESKTWFTRPCSEKRGFICYSDDQVYSLKTVKFGLKTRADVSDAAVQNAIRRQVKRALNERGVANMKRIRMYPREETPPPADDACGTA